MAKRKKVINIRNDALLREIASTPLRTSMIVCAEVANSLLEEILHNHFVNHKTSSNMLESTQPLGTFSARINMAFCLGLISENLFNDLEILRKIRNDYAHSLIIENSMEQSHNDKFNNYFYVNNCFSITDKCSLNFKLRLAFVPILCALIKKVKSVKKLEIHSCELNDLSFDENDFEFLKTLYI